MDLKKIKELIKIFEDSTLLKMDIEVDDLKLKMKKSDNKVVSSSENANISTLNAPFLYDKKIDDVKEEEKYWIKSPLVGTFYSAPSPDAKPFVKVGDYVKEGDVLCIIEAMKVMNEIKSSKSGYITEIKVKNGELLQFDDEIMAIGENK